MLPGFGDFGQSTPGQRVGTLHEPPRSLEEMFASRLPYRIQRKGVPARGVGHLAGGLGDSEVSVGAFGLVTTEMMAVMISRHTGIPTTGDDIVNRAIRSHVFAPGYEATSDAQKRGAALVALAKGFVDGGDVSAAGNRFIPLIEEFGLGKALDVIRLVDQMGLTDVFTSAGESLAGAMLEPLRSLVDAVRDLFGDIGGASFFADVMTEIGNAVSKMAADVASMVPIISAGYKLCSLAADWINSLLMAAPVSDQRAEVFARDPLNLYLYLCKQLGHCGSEYFGGSWTVSFNPFYQETFVHNSSMRGQAALRSVRAIDIGNYHVGSTRLPGWREILGSGVAQAWVNDGTWTDPPGSGRGYFPGHSAQNVVGCPCMMLVAGGYGGVGAVPGRWQQGTKAFRAAALAASYISANVACVKAEGRWSSGGYLDPGDGPYDLGYGPNNELTTWWAKWDGSRVKVLPPETYYAWEETMARYRELARDASSEFSRYLSRAGIGVEELIRRVRMEGLQRCLSWSGSYTDNAPRQAMNRWLTGARWVQFPVASHPYLPKSQLYRSSLPYASIPLIPRVFFPPMDTQDKQPKKTGMSTGAKVAVGVGVTGVVAGVLKLLKVW